MTKHLYWPALLTILGTACIKTEQLDTSDGEKIVERIEGSEAGDCSDEADNALDGLFA